MDFNLLKDIVYGVATFGALIGSAVAAYRAKAAKKSVDHARAELNPVSQPERDELPLEERTSGELLLLVARTQTEQVKRLEDHADSVGESFRAVRADVAQVREDVHSVEQRAESLEEQMRDLASRLGSVENIVANKLEKRLSFLERIAGVKREKVKK